MLRRPLALAALASLAVGPLVLLSAIASADVTGPCTATMNGVDVNTIDSPDSALEVPYDGTIAIDVRSSGQITGHVVTLAPMGGVAITVDEGTDQGTGWSGTVEVSDYATYGVGIYQVTAEATGPGACSGTAFVKVTGKNPLTTVAGAVGAGLTVAGGAGVAASAMSARKKARHDSGLLFSMAEEDYGYVPPERSEPKSGSLQDILERPNETCNSAWVLALPLTVGYMAAGAGVPGAPGLRPVAFRPRVAVGAAVWGVVVGIGTLVLAQQFAVLYPTVLIAVVWLGVCALLSGVAIPSLVRLSAVRKINARLAQRASATGSSVAGSAAVGTATTWTPTRGTPAEGLDAWPQPDPASAEPIRLDPGLHLRVEQVSGDWAQVVASNGWTGWVDARRLEALA